MKLQPKKDKITSLQATLLVVNYMIAAGILTLPRVSVEAVGNADAWLAVLIGGVIVSGFGFLIGKLCQMFPGETIYEFGKRILGRLGGGVITLCFVLFFLSLAAYEVRVLAEFIRLFVLDQTPIAVIIVSFMLVAAYLSIGGINPIARICELYFPVILIVMILILLLSLKNFELDNVRPVLGEGWLPVIKGLVDTSLPYLGVEIMLILAAFLQKPQKVLKSLLIAVYVVTPLYVFVVFIAVGVLTVEDVKTVTWPLMSMAMEAEIVGEIFERFEAFLVVMWVMAMYVTFVIAHYLGSLGAAHIAGKNFKWFIYGFLPLIFLMSLYPSNIVELFELGDYISYLGMTLASILPAFLLLVAKIRRVANGQS